MEKTPVMSQTEGIANAEYVTRDELEARIEHIVQRAVDAAVERTSAIVDDRIKTEQISREKQIANVQADIDGIGRKLAGIDGKLGEVGVTISAMNNGLSRLMGTMESWAMVVQAMSEQSRDAMRRVNQNEEQITRLDVRMDEQSAHATITQSRIAALTRLVQGEEGVDGPPSLFSMLHGIESAMLKRFDQQDNRLDVIGQTVQINRQHITTIEREREQERREREQRARERSDRILKRKQMIAAVIKAVTNNKAALALMSTGLIALFASLMPELAQIVEAVLSLLN